MKGAETTMCEFVLKMDKTILKNIEKGAFCAAKMLLAIALIFWYVSISFKIDNILLECFSAISFCGSVLGIFALEIGAFAIIIGQYQTENEENDVCIPDDVKNDFQGYFSTNECSEIAPKSEDEF